MKQTRQQKLLELIENNVLITQEDLQQGLEALGFQVTQSTVSRDIKELKIIKGRDEKGNYRYLTHRVTGNTHSDNLYIKMFVDGVKSFDYAVNNVVIKCFAGMASSVCVAVDALFGDMMLGSLAGDDTIIIVTHSEAESKALISELGKIKNA
ncbi:MAG: arginine repressor [Clostridia bacterium]|nr:arginine repressor [Clostridia bacterium]